MTLTRAVETFNPRLRKVGGYFDCHDGRVTVPIPAGHPELRAAIGAAGFRVVLATEPDPTGQWWCTPCGRRHLPVRQCPTGWPA